MANINTEKLKLMEDEMNRFEAEIALPVLPPPPPPARPVIGANTYSQVQRRLEEQQTGPGPGPVMQHMQLVPPFQSIPPPPPPPPMLIPHQVQRGQPVRHQMRPMQMGPPPGPPVMMPGPPHSHPMGFMAPHPMNIGMNMNMNMGMNRPGPPFMGPPMSMDGMGPPGMMPPQPQMMPMPPQGPPQSPVVSATPLIYNPKNLTGHIIMPTEPPVEARVPELDKKSAEVASSVPASGVGNKKQVSREKPTESNSRARELIEKTKTTSTVTVGPVAVDDAASTPASGKKKEKKGKKIIRMAGGQTWEDNSLQEWEEDDFRIFCGDLGNDVTDEILVRAFSKYSSFMKAKVVRDKRTNKTKGFGFVSFKDPQDFIKAMKEMNGVYTYCCVQVSAKQAKRMSRTMKFFCV
ncbi:RNA-binding protein 42 isoform X2 [Bacillus rossius redtenbacheri]|uniref:RNA-binding protein 42 isoform X2 n=1 Tax=Bacillus rossius redtenbacheri TaxID=93214 RepID=UPI002FDEF65E